MCNEISYFILLIISDFITDFLVVFVIKIPQEETPRFLKLEEVLVINLIFNSLQVWTLILVILTDIVCFYVYEKKGNVIMEYLNIPDHLLKYSKHLQNVHFKHQN